MLMRFIGCLTVVGLCGGISPLMAQSATMQSERQPNILLIMADDLGFNDIESFGQTVIQTPVLKQLAQEGMRFTNFHVQPTCSPTRAQLLSGVDNHLAGMGSMGEYYVPEMDQYPGRYIGALNDRVKTISEVLGEQGYSTFMTGKWHLGGKEGQLPKARGFQQSYILVGPGGSHWDDNGLLGVHPKARFVENDLPVARDTKQFSSDLYTDKFIEYMDQALVENKPFMGYLSFQAVHDPLHAPKEYVEKYKGKFAAGYDIHRQQNYENMLKLGVIPAGTALSPTAPLFKPWDQLSAEEKEHQQRLMEIYAAMVDNLDVNIGRVLDRLKQSGQYDNTLIFFFSDNGPSGAYMDFYPGNSDGKWIAEQFDTSSENMGAPLSFAGVGPGWASASSAPFRLFKLVQTEGGTISPLIVKGLPTALSNQMNDSFLSVEDIYPTILETTNTERGDEWKGQKLEPLKGFSFVDVLMGKETQVRADDFELGAELFGNKVYRKGKWKILWMPEPFGTAQWQLYDMEKDRSETQDLAAAYPELVAEMSAKYDQWAVDHTTLNWDMNYLFDELFGYFDWRTNTPKQIVNQ